MKLAPFLLLLAPLAAFAKQTPDSSAEFISVCRTTPNCEVRLFLELSKTFRPSRKEDELRDYVLALKDTAEKVVWNQKLETFRDPIGNVLIRLPATGEFVGKNRPYFALQSHMDMVLAYSEAKPGEDIEKYFKDGVTVETKDGWLQSKDNRTTLGADNGIGVAFALSYLINNTIAHPPLELIFTVQEEIGLFGAIQFEVPIQSHKMLCLDGMTPEEGMIIAGSQGAHSEVMHFDPAAADRSGAGDLLLSVAVTKLAGGHSGGDIFRGRTNALKLVAELLGELSKDGHEARIKSLIAGDGVLNKIPNLFQAEIIVPASARADLADHVKDFLHEKIFQNADDAATAQITATVSLAPEGKVGTADFSRFFSASVAAAPNGVIDSDPAYLHSVYTSNNLSSFRFGVNQIGELSAEFGFMARSFSDQRMADISRWLNTEFSNQRYVRDFGAAVMSSYSAWIEPETSTLVQDALARSGYFKTKFYLPVGLEPSGFKQRIPNLEVIALGPMIQFAHTVNEKLQLDSIPRTLDGIQKIIQLQ